MVEKGCIFHQTNVDRRGTNFFKDFKLLRKYYKLLKMIKPQMVFTYTIKPNIYGGIACRLLKFPYVVNITGLGTAVENHGILRCITILLYRVALKRVQRVFFQNETNRQFFAKFHIADQKAHLLPGSGVNLKEYSVLPFPEEDHVEFAFISRIMKEKGVEEFLEMVKHIKVRYPETIFHVCGFCEQDYMGTLEKMQDEDLIIYHGMVNDIKTILARIQCTILPSYHEGMSNVLLETAACGRSVIASDVPGCKETFDEGVSGFGIKPKNAENLINVVEKFLLLPRETRMQMGVAGRKKMEKEFNREIVVNAYIEELKEKKYGCM